MSLFDLLAAAVTFLTIAAIVVAVLSFDAIVDWFVEQIRAGQVNKNQLCVTLLKQIKEGDYKIVQGIFDTTSNQCVVERTVEAKKVDPEFLRAHDRNGRAVWAVRV